MGEEGWIKANALVLATGMHAGMRTDMVLYDARRRRLLPQCIGDANALRRFLTGALPGSTSDK